MRAKYFQNRVIGLGGIYIHPNMNRYTRKVCSHFANEESFYGQFFFYCFEGLTTRQLLWVILCRLPEKGRSDIEEIVEEKDRKERVKLMKVKKQKK